MKDIYEIKKQLLELEEYCKSMNELMCETLLIDDKIFEEEIFIDVMDNIQQIINELSNVVIPIINSNKFF